LPMGRRRRPMIPCQLDAQHGHPTETAGYRAAEWASLYRHRPGVLGHPAALLTGWTR
jgi:hypothetical protein